MVQCGPLNRTFHSPSVATGLAGAELKATYYVNGLLHIPGVCVWDVDEGSLQEIRVDFSVCTSQLSPAPGRALKIKAFVNWGRE